MRNKFLLFAVILFFAGFGFLPNALGSVNISGCSELNVTGETYYLTQDITNSGNIVCMSMSASNVTLDCQGHTIDGVDAFITSGVNCLPTITNGTVKNCILTDWTYGILFENADYNNFTDITISSNHAGLYIYNSDFSTLTNITASSNVNALDIVNSDFNTLTDIVAFNNSNYGLYICDSNSNKINNSVFEGNGYGIYLRSVSSSSLYNNLLNNTNNVYFEVSVYANNWNITKQIGTRIYQGGVSDSIYVGGNYYTNSTGNGYSDTCLDLDCDGFCDSPYAIETDNVDYLPLSDEYTGLEEPSEAIGEIYPILWVLPVFFVLFVLYGIFESLVCKKDLTVEELLKVFFLTIITVVFIMAITGLL